MKCNFNFIVYWYLKELIISKVKSGEYAACVCVCTCSASKVDVPSVSSSIDNEYC